VAEDRIIYVGAGAAAAEASDPLERDAFTAPPAMRIVLSEAMKLNKLKPADIDHVELYSCFPVVPKMAQRELGLSTEMPFTVHGGLTFGGGPLGNYMSHGVIGLVRKLREGGDVGFIYGNGGYSTRHHALALTRKPVEGVSFPQNFVRQKEADALRQPIPEAHDTFEGEVKVETYTVTYDRKGEPTQGVVIARDPTDRRVLALVPKEDKASLAFLTSGKVEPVGSRGIVARNGDKLNWRPA
jgi:acetyl-CoA C-acetyltransferase